MYNTFNRDRISLFLDNLPSWRRTLNWLKQANDETIKQVEQKKEQSKSDPIEIEKAIDQKLVISSMSVGMMTASSFLYAPLSVVALPGLLYQSVDLAQEAFSELRNQNKVSRSFLDLLVFGLCVSQGYYVLGSLALCSHYFTNRILFKSKKDVLQTLSEAVGKEPLMAWVLQDGIEVEVESKTLQVGQSVVIHPGELVPVDGIITEGIALIDERVLSGCGPPAVKNVGEQVICGNILLAGRLVVQIERVGHETSLAKIAMQLAQATENQTTLQDWYQKLSPIMAFSQLVGGSLASFMFNPMSVAAMMGARSDYDQIAPLELAIWLEKGLQEGVWIRQPSVLQHLKQVDTIVIDQLLDQLSAEEQTTLMNQLHTHNITSIYLLGTTAASTERVFAADHYLTAMTKQDKVKLLTQLQSDGATVCYIGECIEPEIQQAIAVSISVFHLTEQEESQVDILLMDSSLQQVNLLLDMAKTFNQRSKRTLITTLGPSLVAFSAPLLFKSGLLTTVALNQIGLFSGLKQAKQSKRENKSLF